MCPGETGTLRRESRVSIVGIIPRCSASGSDCTNENLVSGEKAHYGVIILNASPTGNNKVSRELIYILIIVIFAKFRGHG